MFEGRTFTARTPFENQSLSSSLWLTSSRDFPAPLTAMRWQCISFIERLGTDQGVVLFSRLLIRGFWQEHGPRKPEDAVRRMLGV